MEKINVLIVSGTDLYPGALEEIASVSPNVSVMDGVKQFVAEQRRSGNKWIQVERIEKEMNPEKETEGDLSLLLAEAEIIFGRVAPSQDMLKRAPKLKWVHTSSVGVDYMSMDFPRTGNIIVTNSRGVTAIPIAEHALMLMFMLAKNAPRLVIDKEQRLWERFDTLELRDKTAGLIGLGAIGSEIARLARGVGMRVIATRRSAVTGTEHTPEVDELYPPGKLHELLHNSDYVIIAVPLTPETKGMIGGRELQAMKKTAFMVNIARGKILDETALIQALREHWIAGAGLDVFETEPLDPKSELWSLPNVIISPHIAGTSDRRSQRLVAMFCDNLRRYINKEPMINVISPVKGY
jgi:phosphoglycerate dehydrogenase-like enzyme